MRYPAIPRPPSGFSSADFTCWALVGIKGWKKKSPVKDGRRQRNAPACFALMSFQSTRDTIATTSPPQPPISTRIQYSCLIEFSENRIPRGFFEAIKATSSHTSCSEAQALLDILRPWLGAQRSHSRHMSYSLSFSWEHNFSGADGKLRMLLHINRDRYRTQ